MPQTDYSTYLRIDDLLDLQHPLTPGAHDEMLFIVVHQEYELLFKLILHELDAARNALLKVDPGSAIGPLRRVGVAGELLIATLRLLETMGPEGFLKFRDPLAPASGFQSSQFREIEYIGGGGDPRHAEADYLNDDQRRTLERRMREPTMWRALCQCFEGMGMSMPSGDTAADRETRLASLAALYHDHTDPTRRILHMVCEALLDHDESILRWRHHHVLMASREIGARTGTGGSAGVAYLETTTGKRFFPELWDVRTRL